MDREYDKIDGYLQIVQDLLCQQSVQRMKQYPHHGMINTHFHSVYVSYQVYKCCVFWRIQALKTQDIVRAALLHDLYLYDWHLEKHEKKHAWYHPQAAVRNIEKYRLVVLNDMQREMILSHMFPLSAPPHSLGGWMLTLVDKYCAYRELLHAISSFEPLYQVILERVNQTCKENHGVQNEHQS